MNYAKLSTAKSFLVGPILDADGVAVTSALTATDVIKVTKNGTVGAADAQDTLTHSHTGHYVFASDGGDFDTLGEVEFSLNSGTNAMAPVRFQVLPAVVYDSLVLGTDYLDVNAEQQNGNDVGNQPGNFSLLSIDASGRIDLGKWLGGAPTALSSGLVQSSPSITVLRSGLGVASGDLDTQLTAIKGTTFDTATDSLEAIRNRGDAAWITATGFSTHSAADVVTALGTGSTLTALATATLLSTVAGYLDTEIAAILADTNELQTDWTNGGRLDLLLDATLADTNELQTDWANGGRLDLLVDAILDDTGTSGVAVASGSKTGYTLAAAGLDSVVVETGLNGRQALSIIAAGVAGVLAGAATTSVTIAAAGVPATNRITATVTEDGNRTAVTLSVPT